MATGASSSILTSSPVVLLVLLSLEVLILLLIFFLERRELDGLLWVGDQRGEQIGERRVGKECSS